MSYTSTYASEKARGDDVATRDDEPAVLALTLGVVLLGGAKTVGDEVALLERGDAAVRPTYLTLDAVEHLVLCAETLHDGVVFGGYQVAY